MPTVLETVSVDAVPGEELTESSVRGLLERRELIRAMSFSE
jgi:hypothetical protein